jgi:Trk K+ transport system NAD-binding subunit
VSTDDMGERRRKSVQRTMALVTAFVTGDPEAPDIYEEAVREDAGGVLIAMTNLASALAMTCAEEFDTTPERYLQRLAPKLLADAETDSDPTE